MVSASPITPLVAGWIADPASARVPDDIHIARFAIDGVDVTFAIRHQKDRVQRKMSKGRFYEAEEHELIARFFPKGGVFLDLGANVGNHSIYVMTYLDAKRAITVEPNPAAYELLVVNMIQNGLIDRVDLSYLGFGVSAEAAGGMGLFTVEGNLGATSMVADGGEISVLPADDVVGDGHVDFVKIDVEGMEMDVLAGLEQTVRRCRMPIFLEITNSHRDELDAWMTEHGYQVGAEGRQFRHNGNLLLVAK